MAVSFLDEILVKLNGTSSSKKYLQLNGGGASGSVSGQAGIGFRPLNAGSNVHASIEGLENGNGSYQTHLTFSTNGSSSDSAPSERMRITSAGNVGIGTTAPGSVLHVKGGSATTPANASAFITNATSRFVVNHSNEYGSYIGYANTSNDAIAIQSARSNGTTGVLSLNPYGGNVGIGTTSPGYKLDLNGDVRGNSFWFRANTASAPSATGGFYRPTLGAVAYGYNASELFRITSGGNVGIGTTAPNRLLTVQTTGSGSYLALNSSSNNTTIGSDVFGSFVVYDDSSATYRMVIDQTTGNVGIGTTDPVDKLEVNGNFRLSGNGTGNDSYPINFTNAAVAIARDDNNLDLHAYNAIVFGVSTTSYPTSTERMRITNSGNVGVGTTVPSQKLTVNGTIMSTGASNPQLILQDSTHSDITIKGDSGIFSVTNQSVGQNITMLYNGNIGIGTTSPTSKLQINGLLQAEGINSLYIGTLTVGSSTGWYRAMEWTGSSRGGSVICLSTTGGSFGPVTYVIKAYKTFGNPAGANTLKLEQYGTNAYLTAARITWDSEANKAFVEVYKNVSGSSMPLSMFQDKLIGYDATSTILTGTASTGGGQVLEQLNFVPEGTTMEKLLISDSIAVGGIVNSTTAGRIDAANDVVAFSTSDIRLKDNIKTIDKALDKVNSIQGIEFDWIEKEEVHGNSGHDIGVIAQEIEKILPDVVTTRDSGYKAVKYEKIVPLLIEAIKDLSKQVDGLKRLI